MKKFQTLLKKIMEKGVDKSDRTGTGTRSIFSHEMRFDLSKGLPIVTTRKIHLRSLIYELLWFIQGDTNIKYLNEHGVTIWDEWADRNGDLGPIYGAQWRKWKTPEGTYLDQLMDVIDTIKNNPDSRRIIISAWNVGDIPKMKLPPCHCMFQFYVANGKLSCKLTQRSCDTFLGVPYNIASYAMFVMMIAQVCDLLPGDFIWSGGDTHVYSNHFEQVKLQLSRNPRKLPTLEINPNVKNILDFKYEDFRLVGYNPHPHIKAEISV